MAPRDVKCSVYGRCFRTESDKARYKCTAECQKPVQEQEGAVECLMCGRWGVGEDQLCTNVLDRRRLDRPLDPPWKIKPQRAWQRDHQ